MSSRAMRNWAWFALASGVVVRAISGDVINAYSNYLGSQQDSTQITFVTIVIDTAGQVLLPLGAALLVGCLVIKSVGEMLASQRERT